MRYSELKTSSLTLITSNINITHECNNSKAKNESQTLLLKLKTLNNQQQTHIKSPSGSTAKIRQELSPMDKEIKNLKNEMQT